MANKIKIIFAGTPEFSVPYLAGLLADPDFSVLGVLTQPDRPSGRKQELSPAPIKVLAQKNNLKIWQPEKLKDDSKIIGELKKTGAALLIVVAYGQIIPQAVLDVFPKGCINIHPSLLPKYRGASPIQSAILNGEKETGISIMLMDAKMDHGPILAQEKAQLTGEETNESLHRQLADSGVKLLIETIKKFLSDEIKPIEQNHETATFCAPITKKDGKIDWQKPPEKIKQKIQAFYPWPGTWTTLDGKRLKIFPPVIIDKDESQPAGQITVENEQLTVVCGKGKLIVSKIQLEGKTLITADNFIRGYANLSGKILQ